MNEFHQLVYYLPASPAFLVLQRALVNKNGVKGTPAPVVLSRWLYGSEWVMNDVYSANDSYEGMQGVEVSLTALPFNTTRQVEEFLWSLMVQKSVSQLQLAGQLMKTKRVMALIARHRQMTHWDRYWTLDVDEAIDQYVKYGKHVHHEPSRWPVILVLFLMLLTTFLGGCLGFFARAHTTVVGGNGGDGTTTIADAIRKHRSKFRKEKKALEAAQRTEAEQANAQIQMLHQSVDELRLSLQQRQESENNLKRRLQQNSANFESEKKAMQQRHLHEIEKANTQIRSLQQGLAEAEHYRHDLERFRTNMRDAKDQIESLRVALHAADEELQESKRCMNQLLGDFERTSVDSANEYSQLRERLSGERAKVEELTERLSTATKADATNVGPSCRQDNEAFRTFQDQIYTTVFGNHEGYVSTKQLLNDLCEICGVNGEETAQNFGYGSLSDFLCSREMALRIRIDNGPMGLPVYRGIPNETNAHLRKEHEITSESQAAQIAKLRRILETEKREADATTTNLRQEIKALHEQRRCQICMDRPSDTTYLCGEKTGPKDACGHVACAVCAKDWRSKEKGCHVCRQPIFKCVTLI